MAKAKYRVGEGRRFRGHQAGDIVELDLTEDEERRYTERGSLEKVRADAKTSSDDTKE